MTADESRDVDGIGIRIAVLIAELADRQDRKYPEHTSLVMQAALGEWRKLPNYEEPGS